MIFVAHWNFFTRTNRTACKNPSARRSIGDAGDVERSFDFELTQVRVTRNFVVGADRCVGQRVIDRHDVVVNQVRVLDEKRPGNPMRSSLRKYAAGIILVPVGRDSDIRESMSFSAMRSPSIENSSCSTILADIGPPKSWPVGTTCSKPRNSYSPSAGKL